MLVKSLHGASSSFHGVLRARELRPQGLAVCASEGVLRGYVDLLLLPQGCAAVVAVAPGAVVPPPLPPR